MKKFFKNKWVKGILISIGVLLLVGVGFFWWSNESLPTGKEGAEADALANKMMAATNVEAWKETGAVSWNFAGARQHIWDKTRHYAQVTWEGNVVLVDINPQTGIVKQKGKDNKLSDEELVKKAWETWANDSFWLNPVAKLFDPGTHRKLVKRSNGEDALLISYESGGVTPGDSYLWLVDKNGLPYAWKLWVKIIPVGGLEFSWEKWQTLETGFKASAYHHSKLKDLTLTDMKAAKTLTELTGGEDIFAELEKK